MKLGRKFRNLDKNLMGEASQKPAADKRNFQEIT